MARREPSSESNFYDQLNSNEIFQEFIPEENIKNIQDVRDAEGKIQGVVHEIQSIIDCLDMWKGSSSRTMIARQKTPRMYLNTKNLVKHVQPLSNSRDKLALKFSTLKYVGELFSKNLERIKENYENSVGAVNKLIKIAKQHKIVSGHRGLYVLLNDEKFEALVGMSMKVFVNVTPEGDLVFDYPAGLDSMCFLCVSITTDVIHCIEAYTFTKEDHDEISQASIKVLDNAAFRMISREIRDTEKYSVIEYHDSLLSLKCKVFCN